MTEMARFTTETVRASDRAVAWNAAISDAYFPLSLHFRDPRSFNGELSQADLGAVGLSRLRSDPVQYERRPRHIRSAREEDYLITIPRSTSVAFRQLGQDVRCDPGGFLLERGDEPYRFLYERHNDLFVLKVRKSDLADRIRQPDRYCARVFDATAGAGALFVSMVEQSQTHAGAAGTGAGDLLGRQMLELLVLALENASDSGETSLSAVRAAHLARIEKYIRAHLKSPGLSPDTIAEACGISKRYLHDLFKDVNGTVSQHVRDQRLIAARDQLASLPDVAIAEIAYRYGFTDQAQFSRLFRTRFGVSPSGYRQNLQAPPNA